MSRISCENTTLISAGDAYYAWGNTSEPSRT